MSGNPNYTEKPDGCHKNDQSTQKGSASYYERPAPPVRDGATGHPIGSDGKVDWGRVIKESNNTHPSN